MNNLNLSDYEILKDKILGSGYIATVYLTIHKKTKEKFAMKIVK